MYDDVKVLAHIVRAWLPLIEWAEERYGSDDKPDPTLVEAREMLKHVDEYYA